MGHSRTPTQNTAGEGFPADPIDGYVHPWLRDLWKADGDTDRIHRYLTAGAVIDGVHVRVEELTGEPGDAVIVHPRLLHVVAPNSLHTPRMMLLQFLHRRSLTRPGARR
jgi:hypothetical protein